jgi:hypothetical protein
MPTKYGVYDDPLSYSFAAGGRFILIAPVNEPLPVVTTPINTDSLPANYYSLGACENGEVNVTVTIETEDVVTGIFNTQRRKLITGQGGSVESVLQFYDDRALAYAGGAAQPSSVASTSLSRAHKRLVYGGSLGDIYTLLIPESFDIPLVTDDGTSTFEETWFYSPKTQKDGDINLAQKVGRLPAVNFNFGLLGFTYQSATVVLQHLWLKSA